MMRFLILLFSSAFLLAACGPATVTTVGSDGSAVRTYRISKADTARVQFRMLDGVNALRQAAGLDPVKLDAALNAAAATHSLDMSVQNRPWHFGSDGSSPVERVWRAGYRQTMLGENISESYETETETLAAWMEQDDTREVIVHPEAEHMGLGWHQEPNGKIWWTLIMGGGPTPIPPSPNPLAVTAPPEPTAAAEPPETPAQG